MNTNVTSHFSFTETHSAEIREAPKSQLDDILLFDIRVFAIGLDSLCFHFVSSLFLTSNVGFQYFDGVFNTDGLGEGSKLWFQLLYIRLLLRLGLSPADNVALYLADWSSFYFYHIIFNFNLVQQSFDTFFGLETDFQ